MSPHVRYDLDRLGAQRFQELCTALLLEHFSPLIDCMVRPGKDGQLDGRCEMMPIDYASLFQKPLSYKSLDEQEVFWAFQCKHSQMGDETPRQRALINAFKKEVEAWGKKKKRPTHYILLTNVNFKASQIDEICTLGRFAFGFFDLWHEPKISGLISLNVGLQKTFFLDHFSHFDIATIELAMKRAEKVIEKTSSQTFCDGTEPPKPNENDVKTSIEALVDYEIRFYKANHSFSQALQLDAIHQKCPVEWVTHSYILIQAESANFRQQQT